jgi:hypothetical protein
VAGLGLDRIAAKLGYSQVTVKRLHRAAIEKLRTHFASSGALAPSAPILHDSKPADYSHPGPYALAPS